MEQRRERTRAAAAKAAATRKQRRGEASDASDASEKNARRRQRYAARKAALARESARLRVEWKATRAKRREEMRKRAAARARLWVRISAVVRRTYASGGTHEDTKTVEVLAPSNGRVTDAFVQAAMQADADREVIAESPSTAVEVLSTSHSTFRAPASNLRELADIPMRNATALPIDGMADTNANYDDGQGQCVFKQILGRMHASNRFTRELSTSVALANEMEECAVAEGIPDAEDMLVRGATTRQVMAWCKRRRIVMYAFDPDKQVFMSHVPEKRNAKNPVLAFQVINEHMYLITDKSQLHSVGQSTRLQKGGKSNLIDFARKNLPRTHANTSAWDGDDDPPSRVVTLDSVQDPTSVLAAEVAKARTWPRAIRYTATSSSKASALSSFRLGDTMYYINDDVTSLRELWRKLGVSKWTGESWSAAIDRIKERAGLQLPESDLNPEALRMLTAPGVKGRSHYGIVNGHEGELAPHLTKDFRDARFKVTILSPSTSKRLRDAMKRKYRNVKVGSVVEMRGDVMKKYCTCDERRYVARTDTSYPLAGKLIGWDIAKCHSACAYAPRAPWYVYQNNDTPEPFDGDFRKQGFYWVETEDYTLFNGSNWYHTPMLVMASSRGIEFTVTRQWRPSRTEDPALLRPFLDEVVRVAGGPSDEHAKKLINNFVGCLGRTEQHRTITSLNCSYDSAANWLLKHGVREGASTGSFSIDNVDVPGVGMCYLLAVRKTTPLMSTCLPMYLQILDNTMMRLYEMVESAGGLVDDALAYRKTDMAVVLPTVAPTMRVLDAAAATHGWGTYRPCALPERVGSRRKPKADSPPPPRAWVDVRMDYVNALTIPARPFAAPRTLPNTEDLRDVVVRVLDECGGMMLIGRGGTGKTTVANAVHAVLVERLRAEKVKNEESRVARMAFTHNAVRKLGPGATTIHAFLRIKDGKASSGYLSSASMAALKYIIVDEISLIPGFLWKQLGDLKRTNPHIKFLLVGDMRQCGPVEEVDTRYKEYDNHPTVMALACYQRGVLNTRRRYDKLLWDLSEDPMNAREAYAFGSEQHEMSLCYLNETRRRVNDMMMRARKPDDAVLLPEDPWDDRSQDTWLYEGLPVIGRATRGALEVVNMQRFVVTAVDAEERSIMCTDVDDFSTITVSFDEFHTVLEPAYALTVHRAQGSTLPEQITIYDWDHMDKKLRYTAMTRATAAANIHFRAVESLPSMHVKLHAVIKRKIASAKAADRKRGWNVDRDDYVNVGYVVKQLRQQSNLCAACHEEVKCVGFKRFDVQQFTLQRVDNSRMHVCSNVVIMCLKCNVPHNKEFS